MFLKQIKDITLNDDSISIIREAKFTIDDLETQIEKLPYHGEKLKKFPEVENAKLPPFAQVFYYLFFKELKIPAEDNFFSTYAEWLGGINNNKIIHNGTSYNHIGIKNRLLRTYPSLIRDLHFFYLLKNSQRFDSVSYSLGTDYYDGLDLKIVNDSKTYYVSIYISTSRGVGYKKKKKNRHDYSDFNEIELDVNFNNLKKVGNFYLLTTEYIDIIANRIKN